MGVTSCHVLTCHKSLVRLFLDYTYYYSTYIQYNNTMYNYMYMYVGVEECMLYTWVCRYIRTLLCTYKFYSMLLYNNYIKFCIGIVHYTAAASAGAGFYTMHNAHAYHSYCIHNITINCSTIPLSVGHMHNTPMWNRSNIEYIKQ